LSGRQRIAKRKTYSVWPCRELFAGIKMCGAATGRCRDKIIRALTPPLFGALLNQFLEFFPQNLMRRSTRDSLACLLINKRFCGGPWFRSGGLECAKRRRVFGQFFAKIIFPCFLFAIWTDCYQFEAPDSTQKTRRRSDVKQKSYRETVNVDSIIQICSTVPLTGQAPKIERQNRLIALCALH
jgi:hypothetical protein